jgi:hypothetical protein
LAPLLFKRRGQRFILFLLAAFIYFLFILYWRKLARDVWRMRINKKEARDLFFYFYFYFCTLEDFLIDFSYNVQKRVNLKIQTTLPL